MKPRRGTLPLKIRVPGCEPIRRASGTTDPVMRKKLVRMVHSLHETGRDDLVNAIARGNLKPLQVYNRWKYTRLAELPHAEEMPVFAVTWRGWLEHLDCSDFHRASCKMWLTRLEELMDLTTPIGGAVAALKELREVLKAHPRSFNLARTTLLAFYRDVVGHRHALWNAVADVKPLRVRPTYAKHPLTPDQLREVVKALGDPWGGMAWTMATTGMGWKEYSGDWEREGAGLRIHGGKTAGRDRLIPLVSTCWPCEGTIHAFRWHLNRIERRVTPYDFRRTFAGLMVEAGIPRPRRKAYLGHAHEDITAIYEAQEVREYLAGDAEKLRAYLGEPTGGPTLQMVRA